MGMDPDASRVSNKINFPNYQPEKGKPDTREGHPVVNRSGIDESGSGYTWIDSNSANGPAFDWIDISSTGTQLYLGDDSYETLSLPFEFPFYEELKSTVYVASNGFLSFNAVSASSYNNTQLPNTNTPNDLIAGYWTDLHPYGNVHYLSTADHFIVQFTDVQRYSNSSNYLTFQFILYPNGEIKIQYLADNDSYYNATIGIEDSEGTSGMQIAFNTEFIEDNLAVLISQQTPISIANTSGEVAPGSTDEVAFSIDAEGLMGGSYTGAIRIASNDPRNEQLEVPVNLDVTGVPAIALDNTPLDFGSIMDGATSNQTIILTNEGTDELIISLSTDHEYFSTNNQELSIAAQTSHELELTYNPQATGEHTASLILETNDPENAQLIIALSGVATGAPAISVNPEEFQLALNSGESTTELLSIHNSGESPLTYALSSSLVQTVAVEGSSPPKIIDFSDHKYVRGEPDTRKGHVVNARSGNDGGGGGYSWIDSQSPNGPVFDWVDISSIGTLLPITLDDYRAVALDFNFPFYGDNKSEVYVSSHGFLDFNTENITAYIHTQLPEAQIPNDLIAGYWTDLYPNNNIYYYSTQDYLIVQYTNIKRFASDDNISFQFILYPNGNIKLQYQEVNDSYNNATIGIENAEGSSGMQIAFNTAFVEESLAVLISQQNTINFAQTSGEVAPGSTDEVEVTFDAQGLMGGTYTGAIHITSNDPGNEQFDVPLSLAITGVPAIALSESALHFKSPLLVGETDEQIVSVYNDGTETLVLSSVTVSSELFSISHSTNSLLPGEYTEVLVSFTSPEAGEFNETLTFDSNDPVNSSVELSLHAEAMSAPALSISEEAMTASLYINEVSEARSLVFSNEGGAPLQLNFFNNGESFAENSKIATNRNVGFHAKESQATQERVELPTISNKSANSAYNENVLETYPGFINNSLGMA